MKPASIASPAPRTRKKRTRRLFFGRRDAASVWRGAAWGLGSALAWRALVALGWTSGLEFRLLDALFRVRERRWPHPAVILVSADDATAARARKFPLPRTWHARVVDELKKSGAKTIGFDILFSDDSPDARADRALEEACARAGNVVHGMAFWVPAVRNPEFASSVRAVPAPPPRRFQVREDARNPSRAVLGVWATAPTARLTASSPALGHINAYPESDGVLRRVPPLIRYRGNVYPSLALAVASHFLGVAPNEIEARQGQVLVGAGPGGRQIQVDEDGEAWINWSGGNGMFPTYSYLDVLEGRVPPEVLRGRAVLVGSTAGGSYDQRATPFSPVQPGLEVQAAILNDILQARTLRPPPPWASEAALWILPILLGALAAPLAARASLILGAVFCTALPLASAWALSSRDQVLFLAAPLGACAGAFVLVAASNYRRAWEDSWRADVAVETLARGGSLLSGATGALRPESVAPDGSALPQASLADARTRLAHAATQNLAQALEAPLALWLRAEAPPILAWTLGAPNGDKGGADGAPVLEWTPEECEVLRSLARWAQERPPSHGDLLDASELSGWPGSAVQALQVFGGALGRAGVGGVGRAARSLIVAPLRHDAGAEPGAGTARAASTARTPSAGVLVALSPWHGAWGAREAALGRTVAEQALLALENLEYTHALAGRVRAADRELRDAYEMLSEQTVKMTAAIEGITDALIVTDAHGRAVYVNAAAGRVLRHAAPHAGQDVPQVLLAAGLPDLARGFSMLGADNASLAAEQSEEESQVEFEWRVEEESEARAARSVILAARFSVLRVGGDQRGGRILGAMLIVSDVTAQREGDKMKTDFVSFVAHELRTPLTTILGYASLLQTMGAKMDTQQKEQMASVIIGHCGRLNRMISELLDVSRLDAGHSLLLRLEPADLSALCERLTLESAHAHADRNGLKIRFQPSPPLLVRVDAERVEQVVTNLLSNAVKYSPDGGTVSVQVHASSEHAVISVSDTGMGMSQDQVARLFQKFYRTQTAQARNIKGTGLGLFLVRQLVEAHGGRIEVQSASDQGTTFSVLLPLVQAESSLEWTPVRN